MREIMSFTSAKDAMEWATIIAKSKFCPKEFFNHPESVLVAIAYGAELGLKPLQALQNICVINGKPSIYGDAMLAVCKNHPDFEYIKESFSTQDNVAHCVVKRKTQPEVTVNFGIKEAQCAGLWSKPGPWKQYPARMLQMRARSFALRDCFPDVLKGMIAVEEAQDIQVKDVIDLNHKLESLNESNDLIHRLMTLIANKNISENTIQSWLNKAGVSLLEQLPAGIMQKIIEHLEQMEIPNE